MILPRGVDKRSGLLAALPRLDLSPGQPDEVVDHVDDHDRLTHVEHEQIARPPDRGGIPMPPPSGMPKTLADVVAAIRELAIRGAPAIGIAAAYAFALAAERGEDLEEAEAQLTASRPTAVNLVWALEQMRGDP